MLGFALVGRVLRSHTSQSVAPLIAGDAHPLGIESALDGGGNIRRRSANGFRLVTTLAEGAQHRTELNRQDQSEYAVQFH